MSATISPTISVLTPVLNGERFLRESLGSVLAQEHSGVEHIIADGGSTDGTLRLLDSFPAARVLAGPDRGIYDGINRALQSSSGRIIGILNADDCYAPGVLNEVAAAFEDGGLMAVFGEAVSFRDDAEQDRPIANAHSEPLFMATLGTPIINAWFFRRSVFEQLGVFSAAYRIAGDREFLLRFALSGLRCHRLARVVCRYRAHAGSLTFAGSDGVWQTVLNEHHRMTTEYLRRPGLNPQARELLKQARSRDALQGALYSAEHGQMRQLWTHALAGVRHDPVWLMRFAARAAQLMMKPRTGLPT
jgi:glycosyltransferase involved in cell wall biosynthesis